MELRSQVFQATHQRCDIVLCMQRDLYPKSRSGPWRDLILLICAMGILLTKTLGQIYHCFQNQQMFDEVKAFGTVSPSTAA